MGDLEMTSSVWATRHLKSNFGTRRNLVKKHQNEASHAQYKSGSEASNTTAKAFMKNGIFVNRQNLIRRGDHISQGDISVRVVVKFSSARFKISSDLLIDMKQNVLKGFFVFWCSNFRQFMFWPKISLILIKRIS